MLRWPSFWWGQRMRWPPRRSMLRLAPPIMIGGDAVLARRQAPKGGAAPFYPPGASRGSTLVGVRRRFLDSYADGDSNATSASGAGRDGTSVAAGAKAVRMEHGAPASGRWIPVRCAGAGDFSDVHDSADCHCVLLELHQLRRVHQDGLDRLKIGR